MNAINDLWNRVGLISDLTKRIIKGKITKYLEGKGKK